VNSTKSREVICGGRITAAKINAEQARKQAIEATRDADRAEAHAWSLRIEGYGGPAQPSPAIAQCLNAGCGFLEVKCKRSDTKASIPLDALRRAPNTPIWKLEASLKFRSCRRGRYAPPVHMIRPRRSASIWVRGPLKITLTFQWAHFALTLS
jgi:hypothetical protein